MKRPEGKPVLADEHIRAARSKRSSAAKAYSQGSQEKQGHVHSTYRHITAMKYLLRRTVVLASADLPAC